MKKFKVHKAKEFKTEDVEGTFYTLVSKGRFYGLSTLAWDEESDNAVVVEKDYLTINAKFDLVTKKDEYGRKFKQLLPHEDLGAEVYEEW